MNIPLISLPIAWTVICIAYVVLWPYERRNGDYNFDLLPMAMAAFAIIAALIGWIVYLALT